MVMELNEIEAFVKIAECRTFTKAARELGISQPAISRRITLLESDLETRLFDRLRTGARLTDSGCAFLPYAQRLLAMLRDGVSAVRDADATGQRSITLAIVGTLASTSLMARLQWFRRDHPGVRLLLQTANSNGVSDLVRKGDADLGLRYFSDDSADFVSVEVDRERLVIARAPDSLLIPTHVKDASELAHAPWVSFPIGTGSSGEPFAAVVERCLQRLGLDSAERIVIDSLTAQKRMIEADFGIGIVPRSAIAEEVRLGSLGVLDLDGFDESAPIFMLHRTNAFMNASLRQLVAVIAPGTFAGSSEA
ncbi:LysR family transcriptional regulator [soil metagenome]